MTNEIEKRANDLRIAHLRRFLISRRKSGTLSDDVLMRLLGNKLWQLFGYELLSDYLIQELHYDIDHAADLVLIAVERGWEDGKLYD